MDLAGTFRFSDSVVTITRVDDGSFVDVSPLFERYTGYRRDEAIGRLAIDLGLWTDHDVRARIWGLLRTAGYLCAEPVTLVARDGSALHGYLSCEVFEYQGQTCVLSIMQGLARTQRGRERPGEAAESYRSLFMAAAEGIYRSLPDGGFIDVNPAMARMFGFESPAQMLSEWRRPQRLYVDPRRREALRAELEAGGRIEQWHSEVYRRDGSRIWVSENARAVRDEAGRVMFYEGTFVDITGNLAADEALRQSEALYKVLVENSHDGVFLIQRGRVVFGNPAMAAILGYEASELAGMQYLDLVAPEELAAQQARKAEREGGSTAAQNYEITLLRKDGQRVLCEVHADGVVYNGDIASTGVLRDVTEERRARQALAAAEQKFREIFRYSPVGLFRNRADGTIVEVNEALALMFGYESPEQFLACVGHMSQVYVDYGDRAKLLEALRDAPGPFVNFRTRVHARGRGVLEVELGVRMVRGGDGVDYIEGSVADITARQLAEEALQRSEARYRTLVEHAQVGVFVLLRDQLIYVNHALAAMVGLGEAEVIARGVYAALAPESIEVFRHRLAEREQGGDTPSEFEAVLLHRDGSRVYTTVSVGPLVLDGQVHLTGTIRDITRHRQAELRLKFNATHDPLTGLPNRLLFQQRLDEALRESRASGRCAYAVLFLDLDGFKLVNDSLGHAAGDRLLVVIAERLTQALGGEAVIARYGGDEFTILPRGECARSRAERMAARILTLFEGWFDIGPQRVFSGASVGIVLGHPEYRSPDQVLRDADTAMYQAKAGGKSGYVVFDEAMHRAARARFQLETDLRHALRRREFRVHYQPIVSLADGFVVGCEALVRWQHPLHGLIGPPQFLQAAEEAGLMAELDWWVLEQACEQVARWQQRLGRGRFRVNVNVDERQLAEPSMVAEVEAVLLSKRVEPGALALEVTETVFRDGSGRAVETLAALKRLGVGLVVDDFGTGYSSLDSFASSPFDALKIDRSFVRDMETNRRHLAIVRTITGFADDLGLALTAEGVETEGQARLLIDMGVQYAQGFLYSPARPAAELDRLLETPVRAAGT